MPDRYAVIGNPVAHSKSPEIHALFALETRQNLEYGRLLAPLDGFVDAVRKFIDEGGKGLNVTVPFKFEAFSLANKLTSRAKMAGAVNTLHFKDGIIYGDNTDGAGLVADLTLNAGISLSNSRILLLGAGGAAYGVMLPLLQQKPDIVHIANLSVEKADEMAKQFSGFGKTRVSSYDELNEPYDIVINATSAGLSNAMPPVSSPVFEKYTLALDMVYANRPTPFMQFAGQCGARPRDGFGMLVEQAAESFYVWRGVKPQTKPVFSHFGRE